MKHTYILPLMITALLTLSCDKQEENEPGTPYVTKVLDYRPAAGQFTNQLPKYESGDTQSDMNAKVLHAIGHNNRGLITLGGYGGYVVVGFDHTISNRAGKLDFRILGNAFLSGGTPQGGSCEPGIIMVAHDANHNQKPDNDEWYEIAGSGHLAPTAEPWYQMAKDNGNDVEVYKNYVLTYYKPAKEPATPAEDSTYIHWKDNKGNEGYIAKNAYHTQPYLPLWVDGNQLTFTGTCLPQNAIDESGTGDFYVLYKFNYGYADNATNTQKEAGIDIDWAVDKDGQPVHLPGVDFIKIYTGVNQHNGNIGECSTEIMGIEDLHLLNEDIASW